MISGTDDESAEKNVDGLCNVVNCRLQIHQILSRSRTKAVEIDESNRIVRFLSGSGKVDCFRELVCVGFFPELSRPGRFRELICVRTPNLLLPLC
jgi:hypothetical protein